MKREKQSRLYSILRYLGVILIASTIAALLSYKPYEDVNEASAAKESLVQEKDLYRSPVLPETVMFCDDTVPVYNFDVHESLEREFLVNSYWHTNTILCMKRSKRFFAIIEPILKEEGIPEDFKYLPAIESSFLNATSPAGARGIWQFMPATAKEYKLTVTSEIDQRYDYEKATRAACKYLKKMYADLGNWSLVAAAYNRGRSGLKRAITHQNVDSYYDLYLNQETARYVYRIIAFKYIFSDPEKYGFDVPDSARYSFPVCDVIEVDSTVADLASFAKENGANYKLLKELNPWLRKKTLTVGQNKSYFIKLPQKESRRIK